MNSRKWDNFRHYGMLAVIILIGVIQVAGLALMVAMHTEQDAKCEARSK